MAVLARVSKERYSFLMISLPIIGTKGNYRVSPTKIVCVGLNYGEHVRESPSILASERVGRPIERQADGSPALPKVPVLFPKTPNVLIGSGEPIRIPATFLARAGLVSPRTDYEAELCVVMGRRCRDIGVSEALGAVLGYTCFNDVSQRDIQNGDKSGWWRGKSFDSFGPIGPALLPASAAADPQRLSIECRLNGRVVQRGNTAQMLFSVAELVAYISSCLTLEEGDLIATGTPSGVGGIAAGDIVEVEIGGIGILRNPVEAI
jgi:2-keto-4-pentenoate hydratase/2-oxohepta-3-ene-1,7-dioic acid hydratase in catechol pathway